MKPNILVYGWYGQGNLGDEAFKQAFIDLWGDKANLTFQDYIPENINDYHACFIGGGSFLDQKLPGTDKIQIPIGLIGVGVHDHIHATNWPLLNRAKIIVTRNGNPPVSVECFQASDIVFGRKTYPQAVDKPVDNSGKVLILGNDFLVPRKTDPYWKHAGFNWFVNDFSAVLDDYVASGRGVEFYPMGTPKEDSQVGLHDDRVFANYVVSQMASRDKVTMHVGVASEEKLIERIRAASLVLSLRFHGNIFSTIFGKPFIGIISHDKMRMFFEEQRFGNFLDYYGFTKREFNFRVKNCLVAPDYLLAAAQKEFERWAYISGIVAERFGL